MNRININISFLIVSLFFCLLVHSQQNNISIIPRPVELRTGEGVFTINASTAIVSDKKVSTQLVTYLANQLQIPTGYHLKHKEGGAKNFISLRILSSPEKDLGEEGYQLKVNRDNIIMAANNEKGLFYAVQTLFQLMPSAVFSNKPMPGIQWTVACVDIKDYPRFGWRGFMLDVSRHFFTKDFIKKYMDQMVRYKLNVLHLHLTDDQGWRIEIIGLPRLTEVGAWRVPRQGSWWSFYPPQPGEGTTDGGYYTQKDIRELVSYASERYITILPEIDVPAHSLAMIAAYPDMSCTGKQYDVNPGSRFKGECNVLCVAKDAVWKDLDLIFSQVADLFPGTYIHVGGDEANRSFWMNHQLDKDLMAKENIKDPAEYQSYFTKRLEKLILSKGKRMIGWDEILEGGLAPEATVMSWRGMQGGIKAAQMGHHVIMTPTTNAYLDLYQSDPLVEPETYSMLRLKDCYDFEPVPAGVDQGLILGGQGNLWTESVPNQRHAEYMTWPREIALAEVFWSPSKSRNWDNFIQRLQIHFRFLDYAQVNYATSAFNPIIASVKNEEGDYLVKLSTEINGLDIFYTFDGTNPDHFQKKYTGQPLAIPKGASQIRVRTYLEGRPVGQQINFNLTGLKERLEAKK